MKSLARWLSAILLPGLVAQFVPAAAMAGTPITCLVPPTGLVGWWSGDGNANDRERTNHGNAINGPGFATGTVGQAFSLAGGTQVFTIPDAPDFRLTSSMSINAWIQPTVLPSGFQGMILFRGDDQFGLDPWYLSVTKTGKLRLHLQSFTGEFDLESPSNLLAAGAVHHVAATLDGSTGQVKLYIDGVSVTSATTTVRPFGPLNGGQASVSIGNVDVGYFDQPFTGLIDEVQLHDRALSADEILSIYGAGSMGQCKGTSCVGQPPNLVTWYRAENNADDEQGSNPGMLLGNAGFDTGRIGKGFVLDGSGDAVSAADSPSLRLGSMTLDGWFKFSSPAMGSAQHIVTKTVGSSYFNSYAIWVQDGFLQAGSGIDGNLNSLKHAFSPVPGTWYHVAYVFDDQANAHRLYLNGALVQSGTNPLTPAYDAHPLLVGADVDYESVSYFFPGSIDEVHLFGRALSPDEIADIYSEGIQGSCAAPASGSAGVLQFVSASYEFVEGNREAVIQVERVGGHTGSVKAAAKLLLASKQYRPSIGLGTAGVAFRNGEAGIQTIRIRLRDDQRNLGTIYAGVELRPARGTLLGTQAITTIKVLDNDSN